MDGYFYRLVSGHAHSMPWALLQIDRAESTHDRTVRAVPTDIRILEFVPLLNRVLDLRNENVVLLLTHSGRSLEIWEAAKLNPPR